MSKQSIANNNTNRANVMVVKFDSQEIQTLFITFGMIVVLCAIWNDTCVWSCRISENKKKKKNSSRRMNEFDFVVAIWIHICEIVDDDVVVVAIVVVTVVIYTDMLNSSVVELACVCVLLSESDLCD